MFGKNPIEPNLNDFDGETLRLVNGSPFFTIQGEGPYAGHRATFVRLHGCNLRCTFCDTEFSNDTDPMWKLADLVTEILKWPARLVVITGGEPLRQNILPLCRELRNNNRMVQIETAGTLWIDGLEEFCEIVVSPKTPVIHPGVYTNATAFKYVIDVEQTFEGFVPVTATQPGAQPRKLAAPRPGAPVYLSPMDTYNLERNKENLQLVGTLAKAHGVIAGLQLHKFLNVD